jgi:hypothetical protein
MKNITNRLLNFIDSKSPYSGKCKTLSMSEIHEKIDSYKLSESLTDELKRINNKEKICEILSLIKPLYVGTLHKIHGKEDNESKKRLLKQTDFLVETMITKFVDETLNEPKRCKETHILNPKTNRCVDRTGVTGKHILAKKETEKKKTQKKCKDTHILNPKTNRCVDRNGKTGKKLLT